MVPAALFATAPRMHAGGWAGLRPDEVPAILQRGERVLSRREVQRARGGPGSGGGTVDLRVFVEGGSLKAEVVQLSGEVAARVVEGYDRALPRRLQQITRDQPGNHPPSGHDVCPVSPISAQCRRPAARTWHRDQP